MKLSPETLLKFRRASKGLPQFKGVFQALPEHCLEKMKHPVQTAAP